MQIEALNFLEFCNAKFAFCTAMLIIFHPSKFLNVGVIYCLLKLCIALSFSNLFRSVQEKSFLTLIFQEMYGLCTKKKKIKIFEALKIYIFIYPLKPSVN